MKLSLNSHYKDLRKKKQAMKQKDLKENKWKCFDGE